MAKTNLFALVKSLTKSEKRYFKQFSRLHVKGDKNKYVMLFDLLQKQKVYDEESLIAGLGDKDFTRNFSQVKAALHRLVLKSLRNYHHQSSPEIYSHDQFSDIYLLGKKNEIKQALEVSGRLCDMDYLSDMPEARFWIKNLELGLIVRSNDVQSIREFSTDYLLGQNQLLNEIIVGLKLRHLFISIYEMLRCIGLLNTEEDLNRAKKIIEELDAIDRSNLNSLNIRLYHQTHLFYGYITGNNKWAIEHSRKLVFYAKKHKDKNSTKLYDYLIALGNLLVLEVNFNNKLKLYNEIRQLIGKKTQTGQYADVLCRATTATMTLLLHNGKIKRAKSILINNKILLSFNQIDEPAKLSFMAAAIWIDIFNRQYSNALDFINHFVNEIHNRSSSDFYVLGKITYLVVTFEKHNYSALKSIGNSAIRELKKQRRLDPSLRLFFTAFSKLNTKERRSAQAAVLLFNELKRGLLSLENKTELLIFKSEEICAWIESYTSGNPINQVICSRDFRKQWSFE